MVDLEPSGTSYYTWAAAELDACNPRAAYAAALRAVAAARRERSFNMLFLASKLAVYCLVCGALGPTYRWSQAAPFLDSMEEALPHLKRWLPPAALDQLFEDSVAPLRELRRLCAHSDR